MNHFYLGVSKKFCYLNVHKGRLKGQQMHVRLYSMHKCLTLSHKIVYVLIYAKVHKINCPIFYTYFLIQNPNLSLYDKNKFNIYKD